MVTKRTRRLRGGLTVMALACTPGSAWPAPPELHDSLLNRSVAAYYSNDEAALQAILRFGSDSHIPLGLVVDDQLCSTVISGIKIEHASAEAVIREFAKRLPSYHWDVEDQAVVFVPNSVSEGVARFLTVMPPPYTVSEDVLQGQAVWAWMDIRAALRPREGTAFNILSSVDSEKWPALALRDMTVRQVLNRLVARKGGGAWVLIPFRDFDKVADHRPFWVLDYSDKLSAQTAGQYCSGGQTP